MRYKSIKMLNQRVILLFLLCCIFCVFLVFMLSNILPSASRIRMTVLIDHPDKIQVFYANKTRKDRFEEKYSLESRKLSKGKRHDITFRLDNAPINRLRIDTGNYPGVVRLYRIIIYSHFSAPVLLSPKDIYRVFRPSAEDLKVQLKKEYVEISSKREDPQLISTEPVLRNHLILAWGLPLMGAFLLFLSLQHFDLSRFPPIYDIHAKKPAIGKNINAFDGLRCLAMLMVVADHTWGRFSGLGTGGVWIFLSLSGFLLVKPFMDHPRRMLSFESLCLYFKRRITRIVPVYYAYLIVIYLLNFRFDDAFRHALFLQGNGHLWLVQQLMLFYLLTPILMMANHFLFKNRPWLIIGALTLMMLVSNRFLDISVISMYGMDHQNLRLYIGIFLAGIIFSYLYYQIYQPMAHKLARYKPATIFGFITFILIMFFLIASTERLWGGRRYFAQIYFQWFGIAAGALLFAVLAAQTTWINRVLSWAPLRTIGVVSYSLYLFHPLVLNCIRKGVDYYYGYYLVGFPLFISTFIGSYFVACLTYTYIERPFLNFGKNNKS